MAYFVNKSFEPEMKLKTFGKTTLYGTDWFRIERAVWPGCLLSSRLFNLYAEHIIWNAGLEELQAGIKTARRNVNNLRNDDTTLMAESKGELKSLLMRVKEESKKTSWKLNIIKLKSWHLVPSLHDKLEGKRWKQWQISSSWALKSLWMVSAAMKWEDSCFLAGKLWQT